MEKMKFKDFVWPQNPHTYREEWLREPIYRKNDQGDTVFYMMGPMKRTMRGEGVFFGAGAFDSFRRLSGLFALNSTGTLEHPIWGMRNVYFTELKLTQEPRDNCISYSFAFREADGSGTIPA